eukprot:GHVU01072506.1.p1 GENE.GHVU01072506.1~~GHVU01072506.1.p1  ORF type:complete len:269 (+),score=14.76 GHVU01072506.1:1424-2230(+)
MCLAFVASALFVIYLWIRRPPLSDADYTLFWSSMPGSVFEFEKIKDVDNLKTLFSIMLKYRDSHPTYLIVLLGSVYLFYQAFPLFLLFCPGTAFSISLLIGACFGFWRAFAACTFLSNCGPSLAYFMFRFSGKPIVMKLFRKKVEEFNRQIEVHRSDILSYMVFLRVTPLFPNFFINIASPVINVPYSAFFLGTFIGLLPNTIILVGTGVALKELTDLNLGAKMIGILLLLGFAALLPPFLKRRRSERHRNLKAGIAEASSSGNRKDD